MSQAAKAHGMDGALVEPDWPPLTLDEVRAVVRNFSVLGEPLRILSASPRPFSAASIVSTRGGRVFIKRHHRLVRDSEGLLEEHRFLLHLHEHGAAVPQVFETDSGETAIEAGEWNYEVHEVPEAVDFYEDALSWTPFRSRGHAYSAGQAFARLHLAARGYDGPARKPRPLVASFSIFAAVDPHREMDRYLRSRPALAGDVMTRERCQQALELLSPFHAELLPYLPVLEPLWTHNDLHASNLLWSDAGVDARTMSIIDFGLADRTNSVHDLAHAIERNIVEWLVLVEDPTRPEDVPIHLDHLQALLDGYDSVRPLSADEAAALAPMTALCHVEFALSETDYFLGVLHSEEKAAMASEGWLVGHARWFRSSTGEMLLDSLRRWAQVRRTSRYKS